MKGPRPTVLGVKLRKTRDWRGSGYVAHIKHPRCGRLTVRLSHAWRPGESGWVSFVAGSGNGLSQDTTFDDPCDAANVLDNALRGLGFEEMR